MNINSEVTENAISLDEEVIFQVLMSGEDDFGEISQMKIDSVPASSQFHSMALRIDKNRLKMARLMYNCASREVVCYKKLIRPIVIFIRKFIRKFFLKWYIEPICDQQTEFNVATQKAVTEISAFSEKHLETLNVLFARVNDLEMELEKEKALRIKLEKRISDMEGEND